MRRRCSRGRDSSLDDFDLVELNEAFAAQVLAVLKDLPIPLDRLERQRRRDRARPSDRLHRHAHRRHAAPRDASAARRSAASRRCASAAAWGWRSRWNRVNDSRRRSLRTPRSLRDARAWSASQAVRMPDMRIAVISGDGIGKEVTAEAVKVIRRVGEVFGQPFELEQLPWGADYFLETGVTLPPNGYAMLRDDFDAIFIGALGDPRVPDNRHARDILLGTRFELDLYVNYRPGQAARRASVSAKGPAARRRRLRGLPREHRRALRRHRRHASRRARRTRSRSRKS